MQPLTKPDDIISFGSHLFVAFQNGVGSSGEVNNTTGNGLSTLVEVTRSGDVIRQWDLLGKIDGMGANAATGQVVATVNEDGNSSLYTVDPDGPAGSGLTHYVYNEDLPHGGGTDAVTFYHGMMLISASAPTSVDGPAVYEVTLQPPTTMGGSGTAVVSSLFSDTAAATPADQGAPSTLALTDPDSNVAVPGSSPRFGGDFMLDSQGDQQQVYVRDAGTPSQSLSVLALDQSVNDTAFATAEQGALYATDSSNDTIDVITGAFHPGDAFVAATPCDANSASQDCMANYLGGLDLFSGAVSPLTVVGAKLKPGGLIFVPGESKDDHEQG